MPPKCEKCGNYYTTSRPCACNKDAIQSSSPKQQPDELQQFENAADELNLYSLLVEHFADTTPDEFEAATSVMEVIKQYLRSKSKRESGELKVADPLQPFYATRSGNEENE